MCASANRENILTILTHSLFFLLSPLLEITMNRNRHRASRPIRDADGEYLSKSPAYFTGEGFVPGSGPAAQPSAPPPQRRDAWRQGGFLSALRRQKTYRGAPMQDPHPDMLPAHQQPRDMRRVPEEESSWGEVVSLRDSGDELYFNEARSAREGPPVRFTPTTAPRPAAESYSEGELGGAPAEYNLYHREGPGGRGDGSETGGLLGRHRESRDARIERFAAA